MIKGQRSVSMTLPELVALRTIAERRVRDKITTCREKISCVQNIDEMKMVTGECNVEYSRAVWLLHDVKQAIAELNQ